MKLLESYLWKTALLYILITWLSLTMLDSFFTFLQEIGDDGQSGRYGVLEAFTYVAYTTPQRLYDFFPTATLIGALLGLGQLAANSELTVMRTAGLSIRNIIFILLKMGVVLMLLTFALGEWVAPSASLKAKSYQTEKQEEGVGINRGGIWVKEDGHIIRVKNAWSRDKFSGISIFTIKNDRIHSILFAENGVRQESGKWELSDVVIRIPSDNNIEVTHKEAIMVDKLIPDQMIDITALKAKHLSARELADYIKHQDKNALNTIRLEQAFWTRFSVPLSTLVMLIIAIPFAFGSQRNAGAGQRLFIGILVGLIFFLMNRAMGHISIVYGLSPLLSTLFPLLAFLTLGIVMLRRLR
jgi:lipopolysaccharide export system permease protein